MIDSKAAATALRLGITVRICIGYTPVCSISSLSPDAKRASATGFANDIPPPGDRVCDNHTPDSSRVRAAFTGIVKTEFLDVVSALQLPQRRVDPIAEPVAEEVARHYHHRDHQTREQRSPPSGVDVLAFLADHPTPRWFRRWDTGA